MSYNVKTIAAGAMLSAGVAMAGLVLAQEPPTQTPTPAT
jgi:hypothetical protein